MTCLLTVYKSVSPSAARASEHPTAIVCSADTSSASVGFTSCTLSACAFAFRLPLEALLRLHGATAMRFIGLNEKPRTKAQKAVQPALSDEISCLAARHRHGTNDKSLTITSTATRFPVSAIASQM